MSEAKTVTIKGGFWDGYDDWSSYVTDKPVEECHVPVFMSLKPKVSTQKLAQRLGDGKAKTISIRKAISAAILTSDAEITRFIQQLDARDAGSDVVPSLFVYLDHDTFFDADKQDNGPRLPKPLRSLFVIEHVGLPVRLQRAADIERKRAPRLKRRGTTVIGVIDDGIAFLNSRFCRTTKRGKRKTRFGAFWFQSRERVLDADATAKITVGEVLSRSDINAMLAEKDEAAQYRNLNRRLLGGPTAHITDQGFSHGTAVLDLLAGTDPNNESDWCLVGAQMPPASIADTSGGSLRTHVAMALRWMLSEFDRTAEPEDRIIINISLGTFAGAKDGSGFLDRVIGNELITSPGADVVLAYGNSWRSNQLALLDGKGKDVDWRVLPDDRTASYVEFRTPGRDIAEVAPQIAVTAPDGTTLQIDIPAPGEAHFFADWQAALYHVPARGHAHSIQAPGHLVFAIAPTTAMSGDLPVSPAGRWVFRRTDAGTFPLMLQIQRDDTPVGHQPLGRQSYFAHREDARLDPVTGDHEQPASIGDAAAAWPDGGKGVVRRDGTNSAMTVLAQAFSPVADRFHTIGSAQILGASDGSIQPALYTSEGAPWSGGNPTGSVIVETSHTLGGVHVTGTLSGSVERLSGTSAAAPLYARALASGTPEPSMAPHPRLGSFVLNADGSQRKAS